MNKAWKLSALLVALVVLVSGCTSALHNGTVMKITQVKLTGLPTDPYAPGTKLVFDFCIDWTADKWVHSTPSYLTDSSTANPYSNLVAAVASDGSWTVNISPPLQITSGQLKFLIVDWGNVTPSWNTMKIDKKVSGKSGGDVILDNPWSTTTVQGVVSGDSVTWTYQ